MNAEIVAGTITSTQDALDYITWTYFFRRLLQNPSYYGLEGVDESNLNHFLTGTIRTALATLENCYCVEFDEDGRCELSSCLILVMLKALISPAAYIVLLTLRIIVYFFGFINKVQQCC